MTGRLINYSGFIIAGIGFFLTRFTVTLGITEDPVRFYLAGVVPLALGLGLAAFGVALAVADIEASYVRTTALWCVAGLGTMAVLVVLTLAGSTASPADATTISSQTTLSNFLIGGSVGGTLTGLYAARNGRQRKKLQQQTNRIVTLNRILRHNVLNSVAAIRGYTQLNQTEHPDAMTVIEDRAGIIQDTIEEVGYLTRSTHGDASAGSPVDLAAALTDGIETVTAQYPEADIAVGPIPDAVAVRANERLSDVFVNLLENAVLYGAETTARVAVTTTASTVRISISNDGPGLPESQQNLLETGDIGDFDDPTTGFGLNIVRLLIESYNGTIETAVGDGTTMVSVILPRDATTTQEWKPSRLDLAGVRPAVPHLLVVTVAALLAGVTYGIVSELLGGSVSAIGVFYGIENSLVGWLTHEFHSVVFGFVYVGFLSVALETYRNTLSTYVAVGLAWSVTLWLLAAGVVAPIWLRLLEIPVPIPNLSVPILISHLVWGLSLSLLTAWGYASLIPRVLATDS
ncbi:sensor histidine kinase KdpD [Halolamina sp.]|jgi:signal transduction histidine kinase/uncharacterized membrane protein YagU involved in acid resistance|uniref:sensor histidine kinase n=1 Tax=Halolamina sp. TaxID=1940283 RepID=UPI000223B85F|nr:integral membrane sensor signal transduction histidine kinase [halophilic archaeon DL31]